MEPFDPMNQMLQLIHRSAFCAENGRILAVNGPGQRMLLHPGMEIAPLLQTGQEEYAAFTDGCLYLSLSFGSGSVGASVHKIDGRDVFILEEDEDLTQLQAMALAAQELRRPLASVMTAAEQLLGDTQDPQAARVNRGLFQMLRTVSNMSDAFRYSQDTQENQELREMSAVLEEIFQKAQNLVENTQIQLEFTNLSQSVYTLMDTEKLERAIYNMLSNAMKFTGSGTVLAKASRRGDKLYLSIQDTGNGVDSKVQADIFHRYLRTPGIEDGRYGIGLGMVLIRNAAALHGGTVLLDRPEGCGSRITLSMAIRQNTDGKLRSNTLHVDYSGERDHALIELSDALPASAYAPDKL